MTDQPALPVSRGALWAWPVDLAMYDRTPTLSPDQFAALADRVERSDAGHSFFACQLHPALHRLTRPLHDAMQLTGALPQVGREVTHLFLREMYFRQAPIWGWTDADWLDLFNVERPQRLAHRLSSYRHQVYVIGYVLCGFSNFSATGNVLRYPIAVTVFGRTAVDTAIQRVRTVLLGWGYSLPGIDHHLSKLSCALLLTNRSPWLEDLTIERLAQIHDELPSY